MARSQFNPYTLMGTVGVTTRRPTPRSSDDAGAAYGETRPLGTLHVVAPDGSHVSICWPKNHTNLDVVTSVTPGTPIAAAQ